MKRILERALIVVSYLVSIPLYIVIGAFVGVYEILEAARHRFLHDWYHGIGSYQA